MSSLYKTYLFKNKDPIIDVLRTVIQLWAGIEGLTFSKACARLAKGTGMSVSTFRHWFEGATISPRYANVAAVVNYLQADVPIGARKYTKKGNVYHLPVKKKKAA